MATAEQQAAFTSGAGGTLTMGDFNLMFALIAASLILVFSGWLIYSSFRSWTSKEIDLYDLFWAVVRVFIVVTIFGYFVRP